MSLYVYVGLASFATIWNLIVFCWYGCDRKLKSGIRLLLRTLLLTDDALMTLNIVNVVIIDWIFIHPEWVAGSTLRRVWLPFAYRFCLPAFYTAHMASVYVIIVISVDRYLAIFHPRLSTKYMSSKWQTGGAVVGVWLGSIFVNLPRFFEYRVSVVGVSDDVVTNNTAEVTLIRAPLLENAVYNYVYDYSLYALIMIVFPFGSLTFVHLKLASITRQIRRSASTAVDTSSTCRNCWGFSTISGPFTFVMCVLFQVSPVIVLVTKLVVRLSEVSIQTLLDLTSAEVSANFLSRVYVYMMFSRYIYVDARQMSYDTEHIDVGIDDDCEKVTVSDRRSPTCAPTVQETGHTEVHDGNEDRWKYAIDIPLCKTQHQCSYFTDFHSQNPPLHDNA